MEDDGRHLESSLPSSLIPHLYRHPPLRQYDPDSAPPPLPDLLLNRYPALDRPFVSRPAPAPDPVFAPAPRPARPALPPFAFPDRDRDRAWSEGEAGPSSLVHRDPRYRRTDSLSPRLAPQFDIYGRANSNYDHFTDPVRRDADRDPYLVLPGPPGQHHPTHSYGGPHASHPSDLLSSDVDFAFRHDPYPAYPSVADFSLRTPPRLSLDFRSPGSAEGSSYCRSDSYTDNNDDGLPPEPREGKRRRPEPSQDADQRKNSTPRKTAVACNFCRGRKLRCNGDRPTCSHCAARKIKCEYVSTPKRRGPGKAPKGSRSKKADASRLGPSSTSSNNATAADRLPSSVLPTYELAAQAPEMHPYTHVMSLDTLDVFSFQPPPPAPRYNQSAPDPDWMTSEYYSRTRSPRRRETSSEDWSGAERE